MLDLGGIDIKKTYVSAEKIDPETVKDTSFQEMTCIIKFVVFNKPCACKVYLGSDFGGRTETLESFKIDPNDIKQLNLVIPNIKNIIEGSMPYLIKQCDWFYNETNIEKKKITAADVIQHFDFVSSISVEHFTGKPPYVLIALEGKYPVWDMEHGIGLKVVNGRVVSYGQIGEFL